MDEQRTYTQQLCVNTGCNLEYLSGVMDDRDGWWERVREICAGSVTWWWHNFYWLFVPLTYWPSTELSIKRCTCVNKQKNSGRRWAWNNNITRHRWLESVGDKMPNWEPAADRGLWALSDPWLSNPAKMRKKCCYGQKNLGSIKQSVPVSSSSLTHNRNINPFENKVWEIYFYKEVCSFVHWSLYIMFDYVPHIFVCVHMQLYVLWICNMSSQNICQSNDKKMLINFQINQKADGTLNSFWYLHFDISSDFCSVTYQHQWIII